MKLLAVLLSLLVLSLLQEALCTHLETCECHEIREMVNITVNKAVAGLEDRLSKKMQAMIDGINTTNSRDSLTVQQLLQAIQDQLDYHLPFPNSRNHPGTSCKDIHEKNPNLPSGYYWIGKSRSAVRVYCSMEETCGSETGGWMRVANIDMRNTSQNCPSGLTLISSSKRVCDKPSAGCGGKTFSAHNIQYSRVCGKIIGYQKRYSFAFYYGGRGINSYYVYGVSLTHGTRPRKHIWTFAGAADESGQNPRYQCPCNHLSAGSYVPSFVGNDYFCDTALSRLYTYYGNALYTGDPLWDGKGCGGGNRCCSFNNPPWFTKDLPSPTTDDIEMRVCRGDTSNSTPIETVELYVQ